MLSKKIRVMKFVMEKGRFGGVFCPSVFRKSHMSYEKGMQTYDFLKIEWCLNKYKRNHQLKAGRNVNFIRHMSPLCNEELEI